MALRLGWNPGDWRESFWKGDPSVDWDAMDDAAKESYDRDGDRAHVKLKNGSIEPPTLLRFRALTAEERATIAGLSIRPGETEDGGAGAAWARTLYYAFRVGVELPDVDAAKKIKEHGLSMLPRKLCDALAGNYGDGIWQTYGSLVWNASTLTEDEKKASS